MRANAAALLIGCLGLLLIWVGFTGRLGVVLGAVLCPGQLIPLATWMGQAADVQGQAIGSIEKQAQSAIGQALQIQQGQDQAVQAILGVIGAQFQG